MTQILINGTRTVFSLNNNFYTTYRDANLQKYERKQLRIMKQSDFRLYNNKFLENFIELASSLGFKSIITTNGTLLKKKGHILIEKKVHKVSISIHSFENGDKELHKKYLSEVSDFAIKASQNGIIVVLRLWNNG